MKIIVDVPDGKYCEDCKFMGDSSFSLNPLHRCIAFNEKLNKEKVKLENYSIYKDIKCLPCWNGGEK